MLFKIIIISALLQELSCDNKIKTDREHLFHYQALIIPEKANSTDSCGAVLINSKYLLGFFPCVENLFRTYKNVSLKVVAGLKVIPGLNSELKDYEQLADAVDYVPSKNSKTAIVKVKKPFKKSKRVDFATLPAKGEQFCEKSHAVVLYLPKRKTSRFFFLGFIIGFVVGIAVTVLAYKYLRSLSGKDNYSEKYCKAGKTKNCTQYSRKYELSKIKENKKGKKTISRFTEEVPTHVCKEHSGWPIFCGRTIWGFQTECKQSQTRAGGFDLEVSNINHDMNFIATQTGLKIKNSQDSTKKTAKSSAFTPTPANEIFLLIIVCRLLKLF